MMKRLYCNGKKGYCPHCDGVNDVDCNSFCCKFTDGSGSWWVEEPPKPKKKSKLGYYLFCIRWLWKNRTWENTRQKFKAMEREYYSK